MNATSRVHRAWFFATMALAVALIAVVLWSVYVSIDAGVTISYLGDTLRLQQEQLDVLSQLVPELHRGHSQADVLVLLRELYPDELIVEGQGVVAIQNIEFRFGTDGQLISVEIQ